MPYCKKRRKQDDDEEYQKPNPDNEQFKKDAKDLKDEHVSIERPVFTENIFGSNYKREQSEESEIIQAVKNKAQSLCSFDKKCVKKFLYNRIPCIKWLKDYRIKEYLGYDIVAGLTVGVLYIPQGLAYALLAQCPPIHGLYTCFFPILIYWIFGTSRHCSINTTSIAALIVGNTINALSEKYVPPEDNFNITGTSYLSSNKNDAIMIIASSQAMWVGIFHLIMWLFQFSIVSNYLSEPFTKGFSAGCAIHVLSSQLKYLFGLKLPGQKGAFKLIRIWIDLFSNLKYTNVASLVIALVCIPFLAIIKYGINQKFGHKLPFPIPAELFVVIFGTLSSYLGNFQNIYKVDVVGPIKQGIPTPVPPQPWLITDMITDCIILAIIIYTTSFSLCDVYAKKHNYKINPGQELFAAGVSNIFGSFFNCFTGGASFATSGVQDSAGGKTQVVSWLAASVLLVVFLAIGPLFQLLPHACLASVIVVSLKNLIFQLELLIYYWRSNKIEFIQMLITFLSVVIFDVDIGLAVGVGYYIIVYLFRTQMPNSVVLGHIQGTELYKDIKLYKDAKEIDGIKIVRIEESLHYTNAGAFKSKIFAFTQVKPQDYIIKRNKIDRARERRKKANLHFIQRITPECIQRIFRNYFSKFEKSEGNDLNKESIRDGRDNPVFKNYASRVVIEDDREEYDLKQGNHINEDNDETESQRGGYRGDKNTNKINETDNDISSDDEDYPVYPNPPIHHIIIDCSPLNYVDTYGVKTLYTLVKDYNTIGTKVYLAECNDNIRDRFECMQKAFPLIDLQPYVSDNITHPSVHDAVLHAKRDFKKVITTSVNMQSQNYKL